MFWIDLLLAMVVASFIVLWFKDASRYDILYSLRIFVWMIMGIVLLNRCLP